MQILRIRRQTDKRIRRSCFYMETNFDVSTLTLSWCQVSGLVWCGLAVAVRLLLDTDWSWLLAGNAVLPFLLLLTGLVTTGSLSLANTAPASLLSAGQLNFVGIAIFVTMFVQR